MSAIREQTWTVEEYLEFERASEVRHEYLNGKIRLLPSGNPNHSLILGSTLAALHQQLRKSPCLMFLLAMRLHVTHTGLYTYPDISVVCDPAHYEGNDMLLNPTLIVEVMSPETEGYDRGKKFQHYRTLDSLQEYVLIAQDDHHVERYRRQADGEWLLKDVVGIDASLELASVSCILALSDVYEKVTFDDEETPSEEEL